MELKQQGETLHNRYIAALGKATPEQLKRANEIVSQHLSEYGWSYAEILINLVHEEG